MIVGFLHNSKNCFFFVNLCSEKIILGCICKQTKVKKTLVTQSTKCWTVLHLISRKNDLNYLHDVFHE